jgi:primosomal protein N' (replication factor Y)
LSNLELNTGKAHKERSTYFADVILPVPVERSYTYRIPFSMQDAVEPGCRVAVQFGRKKVLTGIVHTVHTQAPVHYEAKPLLDLLDRVPHVNRQQLELMAWMSDYYMCTQGEVLNQALPSGLKLNSESKIQLHPDLHEDFDGDLFSEKERILLEMLEREGVITYSQAQEVLQIKSYVSILRSLIDKGAILIFEELRERYAPRKDTRLRLAAALAQDRGALEDLVNGLEKKPGQLQIILHYLQKVPVLTRPEANEGGLSQSSFLDRGLSRSSVNTLVKHGILDRFQTVVSRFGEASTPAEQVQVDLSPAQKQVVDEIFRQFADRQTVLLHGITGSGKTEIYMAMIREVLDQGSQVLYMLPEIALTTQIVSRLRKVFGDTMGVYHSRYSDNERVEVWRGVLEGRFNMVVGVRSAVFLPFDDLGLIIVDEEHETSYKQFDRSPRYNARDVAQVLAKIHHARVLLGSATPSFESFYLACNQKYGLASLVERFGKGRLPEIIFADMLSERKHKSARAGFSSFLVEQMEQAIATGKQVIIFQNRRGYSPFITCEECAWIPKCSRCAVSLTYHMYSNQLRCHYCGFNEVLPATCHACGSVRLKTVGAGTEKLEEDLRLVLPDARIQRMDLDTTRRKYSYQTIIDGFESGSIDVLIGTQMVSKGLDFKGVSLVGIYDLDRMLHFPDFRATERAFQLSVQVSGRAGRVDEHGKVVIQTADINQSVLEFIARQDYIGFYRHELQERKKYKYPPYFRIIKITCKHRDKDVVHLASVQLYSRVCEVVHGDNVLAPHEPLISRIRNMYLMDILIKLERGTSDSTAIKNALRSSARALLADKAFRQVLVVFDVDPY